MTDDPALPDRRIYTEIEIARLVANVILRAADKIGIDTRDATSFEDICTEIVLISPLDGRIDGFEYASAWWLLQPPGSPLPF